MEGTRLGPYLIDRELGAGGMGKVYAATVVGRAPGLDAGTHVALKVVHPHLLETEGFFMRFLKEAQIGASIHHENVVRTFMADALGQQHYLVMEYVEGQTLGELLRELDKVPEELCRHVGREICKGLSAIHAAGVVHRDLKPENVLITEEHVVKVMDLGVARLADEALRLSQSGAFVGSVEYAAPEQFDGSEVDQRCDLHALGLLLYELSCGQHPYRGDSFPVVMKRVREDAPRRIGDINPQLSAFFEELVHTLLAKKRDDRFASADEVFGVLEEGESSAWWKARAKALQAETKRPIRRIRIPRETAVYGRDKEIERLRGLFEQAKSGDGQAVLIEGEAGIGKSRLVDELIGRLQADGEDINFLFGGYPPSGAASAAGGFSSAYREHFGGAGSSDYLVQTPLLVPAFDAVLRGEPAPKDAVELTKDSLATCFVHATRNLAVERTTVVLIDDLHFAPEEARALFTSVALAVPGHRVLLVGTMRPGVPEDWVANLTRLDQTTRIEVPRLGPKDLALLLKDSFKSQQLAEQLSFQISTKSDGNPFFAFEIIRGLREGQFITQKDDGTWASTRVIDEIQIPSSVLDLVNARVADLSEEERDLLDVACCWGFEFDPLTVGEVLGLARIPLLKRLGQIERQHRLVRASGRSYVFDHHQVQEALYGSLSELLREEYHAALADALAARAKAAEKDPETLEGALCVDLCEHYLKGARGEDAARYLEAAQSHLTKGYMNAEMATLTERALAVPDLLVGIERAKTLLRLAAALDLMGRRARQEACAREAEVLAEEASDEEVRGKAAMALGLVFYRTSRQEEAKASYRRALEIARSRGDRKAEAGATGNLGVVFQSLGRLPEAQEHFERHLALSREIGNRAGEAIATGNLGNVFGSEGRLPEAREHMERHLALSREIGDRQGEADATGNLGLVFYSEGRLPEAREHQERGLTIAREIGSRHCEAIVLVNLVPLWHALGDRVRARQALDQSVALCREIGAPYPEGYGLLDLGRLADEEGDSAEALRLTEESLALRRKIGHGDGVADALIALGDLRRRAGDADLARAALAEALTLSREQGRNASVAHALCVLARLPGGDAEAACAALAEAGADADSPALRLHLWKATGDRAHLEEAKRLLDDALAKVPAEHHESMLTNLRVNREILAAYREEFGEEGEGHGPADSDDASESATRIVPRV